MGTSWLATLLPFWFCRRWSIIFLVGDSFIDGIMDGQTLAERKESEKNMVFRIK